MTTATKPLPEHGADDRCYRHGCRREDCRASYRNTRKRADLRRARGIDGHINGPRVAAHIRTLLTSGHTRLQIAALSGVSDRAIRYILAGQPEVQLANARALLAVQPLPEAPRVDATGTRRRIQALATLGWPVTHTADDIGISRRYVFDILDCTAPMVEREVATRMAAVYRAKASRPGPSMFSRNNAARNGWHGPLAWGSNINDPAAEPDTEGIGYQAPNPKRDPLRQDEIRHLAAFEFSADTIAKQVGLPVKDVETRIGKIRAEKAAKAAKQAAA